MVLKVIASAKVSATGGLSIPLDVRKQLEIKKSERIVILKDDTGKIILHPGRLDEALPTPVVVLTAATISTHGQISLPSEVRELLDVPKGGLVLFLLDDKGRVLLGQSKLDIDVTSARKEPSERNPDNLKDVKEKENA